MTNVISKKPPSTARDLIMNLFHIMISSVVICLNTKSSTP